MIANPKIKVKPTLFTTIIEIINYFLLILFWVITSLVYKHLPNKIPTHYNGFGEVDAYGDHTTIFLLPLIATVLFLIVSISTKIHKLLNIQYQLQSKMQKHNIKMRCALCSLSNFLCYSFLYLSIIKPYK